MNVMTRTCHGACLDTGAFTSNRAGPEPSLQIMSTCDVEPERCAHEALFRRLVFPLGCRVAPRFSLWDEFKENKKKWEAYMDEERKVREAEKKARHEEYLRKL